MREGKKGATRVSSFEPRKAGSCHDPSTPDTPGSKETGRLEAFSDGVFAIAITLLVLELKVPDLGTNNGSATLAKVLLNQWPSYVGLVTSFFTVLIMWIHHHAILKNVWRTDVAAFRKRLPAAVRDVCSIPYIDPRCLSPNPRGKNDDIPFI